MGSLVIGDDPEKPCSWKRYSLVRNGGTIRPLLDPHLVHRVHLQNVGVHGDWVEKVAFPSVLSAGRKRVSTRVSKSIKYRTFINRIDVYVGDGEGTTCPRSTSSVTCL